MSNKDRAFFGHPLGLSTLFATEFWERFSYYGMRGFFVLFLTAELASGGFGLDETGAYAIYGLFTSLVYLTPIAGGIIADKLWGQRFSIYVGALMMALGQFAMAAGSYYGKVTHTGELQHIQQFMLFAGLGLLILGNGFFKPVISTMVGGLYQDGDNERDNGFTIFYMGINLGALITNFIGGTLAEKIGWHWGFVAAGMGMVASTIWFFIRETSVQQRETGKHIGLRPKDDAMTKTRLNSTDWGKIVMYALGISALILVIVYGILALPSIAVKIIAITAAVIGFGYLGITIFNGTSGKTEWSRVGVIFVLAFFNIAFWSGFEQAGTSFNTFANELTDRVVFGWEIPASWFQSVNALFIVLLAPVFTIIWDKLSAKKLNPRTPNKFGFSLVFLSIGFLIIAIANDYAATSLVSPFWLVLVYLLHTMGELCMSPVGLSMITKLSPHKITSVMMGTWFASIALGNYLAAAMTAICKWLGLPTFYFIAIYSIILAGVAFAIAPKLNKMMKGIH
nr:oligopeptide:H+ symporter [uncultured Carboxylicivirga sp.]